MFLFKKDSFLQRSQLVSGHAYVFKDGHVRLYLGSDKRSKALIFYTVGCMALYPVALGEVVPLWGDWQVAQLKGMCRSILSFRYNQSAVVSRTNMPSIYGSIGSIFSKGEIEGWLIQTGKGGNLNYSDAS